MNFSLTTHSKHIILTIIVLVFLLLCIWKVVAYLDGRAHDEAVLARAQVEADINKAKILANTTATDSAALQTQINILASSNSQLSSRITSLQSQLSIQRQKDSSLPPPDLAARWAALVKQPTSEFQPSQTGIVVSVAASHATVDALEEIPVLQEQIKSITDNSSKKDDVIAGQKKVIDDKTAEINQCNITLKDSDTAHKKEISELKAANRKKNLITSVLSFVGGIVFGRKF